MKTWIRWVIVMAAGLLLAHAAASEPTNGTEAVVTDAEGHQLVGYGVVTNGLLMLRLGATPESFVLLLIAPDGGIQRFDGVRGAGGALLVDLPDGSRETLTSYLSKGDVAMRIVHGKGGKTSASDSSHEAGSGGASSSDGSTDSSGGSSGSDSSTPGDNSISIDTGDSSSTDSSSSGSGTDGP